MNTRHYLGMFDDAGAHLMFQLGYSLERDASTGIGWADVEQTIRYKGEAKSGTLIEIRSAPLTYSAKAIRYRHEMHNLTTEVTLATLDGVVVCFDLIARRARPLPEAIAAHCSELGAEPA
jgi:acyl-CoA thioester hydrolase